MKKKILSIIVCCAILISLLPRTQLVSFAATSGTCGENLTWTLNKGTLTISGSGDMQNYYGWSSAPWWSSRGTITSVNIDSRVTSIGNCAFGGFSNVTSISIPNGVTYIGRGAFTDCSSLTSVVIPENVVSPIGESTFSGCYSLSSVNIPEGITSIGQSAFQNCALNSIEIPNSVTSIGNYAFDGCYSLRNVFYDGTETQWNKIYIGTGNNYLKSATKNYYNKLLEYITYTVSNGKVKITKCDTNVSGNRTIPSMIENCPVTFIDYYAFKGCDKLKSISIPDTVTDIFGSAFENCTSLSEITLSNSLEWIGGSAFGNCTSLINIKLPASVSGIGDAAFYGCNNLKNIEVNENSLNYCSKNGVLFNKELTTIIQYPIGKSENTYSIPDGVLLIAAYCFKDSGHLNTITIPRSVKNIYNSAFSGCSNLKNVSYNGSVEEWNKIAVSSYNTALTNATKHFFAYVTILDKNNNEISYKKQNIGESVDVSAVMIPEGFEVVLYKDKDRKEVYDQNALISENLRLYVDFVELSANPTPITYSFGQTVQIGLIEPWFLKANARVYTDANPTNIDYSSLVDYGAYFIRKSKLSNTSATQTSVTVEDIVNDEDVVQYSKAGGTATIDGSYITATYDKGLYTYELDDSVFVLFYIQDEAGKQYAPIRERNLKSLCETRMNDAENFPNDLERSVYSAILEMYNATKAYRDDYYTNN